MSLTWLLVELARGILPPDEPEVLRAAAGLLFRAEANLHPRRARSLGERARQPGRSLRAIEGLVRESLDIDLQRRLEELILARVEPEWLPKYAELVDPGEIRGQFLLGLPGPHPLIALAVLAHRFGGISALEPDRQEANTRAKRSLHAHFAEERKRLPVRWLDSFPAGPPVERENAIFATTNQNFPTDSALPVRPVFVHRERDKRWRIRLGAAGDLDTARSLLAEHAAAWPGQHLCA